MRGRAGHRVAGPGARSVRVKGPAWRSGPPARTRSPATPWTSGYRARGRPVPGSRRAPRSPSPRFDPDEQAERGVGEQADGARHPHGRPAGPSLQADLPQRAPPSVLQQPDAASVQRRHGVDPLADRGRPARAAGQHEHLPVAGHDRAVAQRGHAEPVLTGGEAADPPAGAAVDVEQPRRVARHQQPQPGGTGQRPALEVARRLLGGRGAGRERRSPGAWPPGRRARQARRRCSPPRPPAGRRRPGGRRPAGGKLVGRGPCGPSSR